MEKLLEAEEELKRKQKEDEKVIRLLFLLVGGIASIIWNQLLKVKMR